MSEPYREVVFGTFNDQSRTVVEQWLKSKELSFIQLKSGLLVLDTVSKMNHALAAMTDKTGTEQHLAIPEDLRDHVTFITALSPTKPQNSDVSPP